MILAIIFHRFAPQSLQTYCHQIHNLNIHQAYASILLVPSQFFVSCSWTQSYLSSASGLSTDLPILIFFFSMNPANPEILVTL